MFISAGHDVEYGKRDPGESSFLTAIDGAPLVVIAILFTACAGVLPPLAQSLRGKIVIDATNPLNADYSPLVLADGRSAAEEISDLLPESRIVRAFNSVFADNMTGERLLRRDSRVTAFLSGNHDTANAAVAQLATEIGFAPLELRPLSAARYLEAMTHLLIANAFGIGRGTYGALLFSSSLNLIRQDANLVVTERRASSHALKGTLSCCYPDS